ncbi:acetylserotonin O-methyltransferase-like [Ahaetulla prasina]|uniref:acetylserotonin O-methyltransferase-like n=1 Tax=Ahaetulla prasina TaxID=499056 RepID=UPI0026480E77|nr:acetylserotonin O-methyltransferase-like [Ahaetulla prasina]
MSSAEETENIETFFHYQYSFVISKIIFTASELGVFDLLRESGELLSSLTVAERLNTSLTGMQTLLRACVVLKVLKVEWKDGKDLYGNTEFADLFLAKSSPKSQYYSMKLSSEHAYPSLRYLPEIVRSNEGAESLFRHTNEIWTLHGKEVVSSFDLSGFQLIYNLDGHSVGLAKELISKYPNCTVKVFDLPEIVEKSKKYNAFSDDSQISFHEGDCFKDPIPEADLYILSKAMYNWSDEKCIQMLTKLFMACKPGGGVLVAEPIVDEEISGSLSAHLFSVLMLLCEEGKQRKASEQHTLFNTAGFKDVQFKKEVKVVNIHDTPFSYVLHNNNPLRSYFTASELGVFDLLRESGELMTSATVAELLKTSLMGMQILLGTCVGLKVLKVEWKKGKDHYGNTEFANAFLTKSSPKSQYYTMKFFSECAYSSLRYLPEAVRYLP